MVLNSLSGRFLILTVLFVMLAEVLIFVPSVARFRHDYLQLRLEKAQIAALALLADDMIDDELEKELLENAGVYNVVLRRNEMRQLVLSSELPEPVSKTIDLRHAAPFDLIRDAILRLIDPDPEIIRVIGAPVQGAGLEIEVTMNSAPLRKAMLDYGLSILGLSLVISAITALLLFLAVRRFLVSPIRRVVTHMKSYAAAPEDSRRIIKPQAGISELREAEAALQSMQTQLTGSLKQKERLAQLGSAVAKVSHDLRNILTTAQLFTDRLEMSEDPAVARAVPKLVNSISRAVNLCETTLAFGKAEEHPPRLERIALGPVVEDVIESERMAGGDEDVKYRIEIPPGLVLRADSEQLYRVLLNLVRNARQAIAASGRAGEITISAEEGDETWEIHITDTGPGLPPKARENLFTPFQGGVRKGGTGLGLAIAAELIRGHGGRLELLGSDETGTAFRICLPKSEIAFGEAAE